VERKGNASKTVLVNVSAVAEALHRPPIYLIKYFGFELSTPVQMNSTNGLYVIKGAHNQKILQDLLDNFISKFVLCRYCGNPETELSFHKKNGNKICQRCDACGNTHAISMDSHKLTTFISKNCLQENGNNEGHNSQESIPTEQGATNNANDDDDGNEDWGDDLASNITNLGIDVKSMIQSEDFDNLVHEYCEQFISLLKKKKLANQLNDPLSIQELIIEAERLKILEKVPFFVPECLFTDQIVKEIEVYKMLLQKLCAKNIKGQKYLLHGLETIIGKNNEIRAKLFNTKGMSKILLKLYEEDIIVEEVFYEWYKKASKQLVDKAISEDIRKYAKEFIEWLRTAEESSDEEVDGVSNLRSPSESDLGH
ncbi:unnamed protein product, partial [Rotaria sordida]